MWNAQDAWGRGIQKIRQSFPETIKRPLRNLRSFLPPSLQRSAAFRQTRRFLEDSEYWSADQFRSYQWAKLREILDHAARFVPAYREKFSASNVKIQDLQSLDDLKRLPFLSKEELRANYEPFKAQNLRPDELELFTSGGTTGIPTRFYHLREYNDDVAAACKENMWKRAGYRWGRSRAIDLTASFQEATRFEASQNIFYISIAALESGKFAQYKKSLEDLRPEFIIGFPSTVASLARLMQDAGAALPTVRGIIIASEVLYEDQRDLLKAMFGVPVLQWYGMGEYAGFASGCEHSEDYHFFPQLGILELIDAQGQPLHEEGQEGEIVLTGFYNWATPFIRYRTGDRGRWGPASCPQCRRPYPLLRQITGRLREFLVADDGRQIPNSALNFHNNLFEHILCYQFYQDVPGRVTLKLVKSASVGETQVEAIRAAVSSKLGEGVTLEVCFVEDIPRTPRGKHKFIEQKIKPQEAVT